MKVTILLVLTLFLAFACYPTKEVSEKNATKKVEVTKDELNGNWTMIRYSAFRPQMPELKPGDIIWKINTKNSNIAVLKKSPEQHSFMGPDVGSYTYKKDEKTITVANTKYFYQAINEVK